MKKVIMFAILLVSTFTFAFPNECYQPSDNNLLISVPVPKNFSEAKRIKVTRECSYQAALSGILQYVKGLKATNVREYYDAEVGVSGAFAELNTGGKVWFNPQGVIAVRSEPGFVKTYVTEKSNVDSLGVREPYHIYPSIIVKTHTQSLPSGEAIVYDEVSIYRGALAKNCSRLDRGCFYLPLEGLQTVTLSDERQLSFFDYMVDFDEWTNCLIQGLAK